MKINPNITVEECEKKIEDFSILLTINLDEYNKLYEEYEAYKMHLEFLKDNYKDITNTEL